MRPSRGRRVTLVITIFVILIVSLVGIYFGYFAGAGERIIPQPVYVNLSPTPIASPTSSASVFSIGNSWSTSSIDHSYTFTFYLPETARKTTDNEYLCPFAVKDKNATPIDLARILSTDVVVCSPQISGAYTSEFSGWLNDSTFVLRSASGALKAVDVQEMTVTDAQFDVSSYEYIAADRSFNHLVLKLRENDDRRETYRVFKRTETSPMQEFSFEKKTAGQVHHLEFDPVHNGLVLIVRMFEEQENVLRARHWFKFYSLESFTMRDLLVPEPNQAIESGCALGYFTYRLEEITYTGLSCLNLKSQYIGSDGKVHLPF